MKITDYESITKLKTTDAFLVDGSDGTRQIPGSAFPFAMFDLASVYMHRMIFRGKNLGTSVSTGQKAAIQNGTFEDIFVGDYWEIGDVKWRIVDIDYWYNVGDVALTNHHVVVMPDTNLYTAKMNASSITTGGYTGSQMYTTNLANAKSTVQSAFASNLLNHREYLVNAVTSGYPSNGDWTDSSVDLPNEVMIYGSYHYTPGGDGTVIPKRYTSSFKQLALFMIAPIFINTNGAGDRMSYWLRDVVSASRFARVTDYGPVSEAASSLDYGVRPVFAVG